MAVMDNLFLPSDQRDMRFLDVYAKYEAEFEHDVTSGASVGSASQKVLARGGAVGGDNSELRRSVGRMQCGWQ